MKKLLIISGIIILSLVVFLIFNFLYKPMDKKLQDKTIVKYFGNEARGDFNNDGKEDVVYLYTEDGGGSGTFYYVKAKLGTEDGFVETNGILLGDRIAPQTTNFMEGKIIVNYADRAIDEPMTTKPSIGISKYLKVVGLQLVEL
ncbi:MAG: hypothetical protein A2725_02195 [Candidatus Magasanikbacteria bacterium RIFCSPHIGHO2_01_FULL_33_34]|uniref:ASPIC/UnbV domain-containing protein n=1 Tax=Candidatus Magasanikbacteria bacterium RIFCSPHIGHO2_01_FULL_33_34 TaxID=1798671 RepID=A0A1F6LKB6_9BACT|nr:MAG: hypothetical protein A2725_02195 [Candidatus Magasanikbacteria bacterium RIFCSPHIGHO2_01_FULL_33_34]OGH76289.1 MAG: hypothetical protein A3A89_02590 [Candidatus Magasanikbacteria bacterium RIFCSPLOWO2_01_FULL_33_34]OGH81516.1 MAG: hypothetical protein A3F93_00985 [Candidatus Magasanikbacteria bacterium RIFCSPLOWO2_12_FULL_34_7]